MNSINATSTTLLSTIAGNLEVGSSTPIHGLTRDQLNVAGRINTGDWFEAECPGFWGRVGSLASDNSVACRDFAFQEDTAASLSDAITGSGENPYFTFGPDIANANSGGGMFMSLSPRIMTAATNTPIMEFAISGNVPQNQVAGADFASSTAYAGLIGSTPFGTTFETLPTTGCYITASSTIADWKAICTVAGVAETIVDTGFSSTTSTFLRFRIEMDRTEGRFYVQSTSTSLTLFATISGTSYPATQGLTSAIVSARTDAGSFPALAVQYIRVWFQRTLWPF
jgi:hypothetical protein